MAIIPLKNGFNAVYIETDKEIPVMQLTTDLLEKIKNKFKKEI